MEQELQNSKELKEGLQGFGIDSPFKLIVINHTGAAANFAIYQQYPETARIINSLVLKTNRRK